MNWLYIWILHFCLTASTLLGNSYFQPQANSYQKDSHSEQNNRLVESLYYKNTLWPYPNYFSLGHTEGKGIGYSKGYTTLGLFLAPSFWLTSHYQMFFDVKAYGFNDGKWAASTGVGTRFFVPSKNIVLGFNTYYDYRRVHHLHFNQIGVGLEVLTPYCDFRVNGYIPVDRRDVREYRLFNWSDEFFAVRQRRVSAWYGVDAEVGVWLKKQYCDDWFGMYLAAGPYYYCRECKNRRFFEDNSNHEALGGRVRLMARICHVLDVSIITTYDSIWHTNVQGQITLTIPFDRNFFNSKTQCKRSCTPCLTKQIALQPVQRNGIIATDKECCWIWNWSDGGSPTSQSIHPSSFESLLNHSFERH